MNVIITQSSAKNNLRIYIINVIQWLELEENL
jgi:hypothetical protein